MFQCPYCNSVNADDGVRSGRCPTCGSRVLWGDEPDTPAADTPPQPSEASPPPSAIATVPGPPRLLESNASLDSVVRTIVDRAAYEAAQQEAAPAANSTVEVENAVNPGAQTKGALDATNDVGLHSAAAAVAVDELWKGTIAPSSTPRMTLKSQVVISEPQSGLVIRSRQMRHTGEYGSAEADYELLERIGEGGVGIVYAARQASVDRTVAIKMLKPESKLDADSRQKFLGEAIVTGDLDHPNIVPIYDLGADDRGALFYSMKRVRGTPWSEVITKKSLPENLEILMKVADAIAFAHSRGIIHRDIKPENVMLGDFGEVLVMDWGIALSTSMCVRSGNITQSQSMGGTPAYMAPEMAMGPIDTIGETSDVYLLGGVLYEIITGNPPHTGTDVLACLHAAARNEIRPTDKTGELLEIAYHAMATQPGSRPATVREFQDAIRAYQSHSESIALATRAASDLRSAEKSQVYQDFARAVFAAQEALALWPQNESAALVLEQSQLAYAQCAWSKEDYDLGLSLLDEFNVAHQPLIKKLAHGQRERANRQRRLRQLRSIAAAMAVAIIVVVSVGLIFIRDRNQRLNAQNKVLGEQTRQLVENESNLKSLNTSLEEKSQDLTKQKEQVERTAGDLARQRVVAESNAREALDKERFAEQVSYLSQIGLAAAQTRENAFLNIRQLLSAYERPKLAHLRHWEWGRLRYLSSLAAFDQMADGRVESLAFAPGDPSFIVTGTVSGALQFWDTTKWQPTTHLLPQPILTLALSPDAQLLAVACVEPEHRILVWKTADWRALAPGAEPPEPLYTLRGHKDGLLYLSFDPTGERLLSTAEDQTARLWHLKSQTAVEFAGHAGSVWGGVISPDGQRVFTAGDDRTVGIWDARTGTRIERFRGHKGPVYCIACMEGPSAGTYDIVSGGTDRRLLLWNSADVRGTDFKAVRARIVGEVTTDAAPTEEAKYRVLGTHASDIYDVRFSPDNRYVVSCGNDNTVRVWDRNADERAGAYRVLRGHGGWIQACAMLDDRRVVSAGYDQTLKVWDLPSYHESLPLAGHEDAIIAATFSRDGSRVVTAARNRKAIVWDAATAEQIATLDEGHTFLTSGVQFFGPGDERLLTSAGDGTSAIWNIRQGTQLRQLTGTGSQGAAAVSPDKKWIVTGSSQQAALIWNVDDDTLAPFAGKHGAGITCVAVGQEANAPYPLFFSGDSSGQGILWTRDEAAGTWKIAGRIAHYPGFAITQAAFTSNGDRLITAGADHRVKQWNALTGEELADGILQHQDAVRLMQLSPNDELLATVTSLSQEEQLLQIWNLHEHRVVREHHLTNETAQCLAFSPDSKTIAYCDSSSHNSIWRMDLETGHVAPFWRQGSLQSSIWGLAYAPDGNAIATVGGNHARLWRVADGERMQSFRPHGLLSSADFSPSGQLVITAGSGGIAKIWNVGTQRVIAKLEGGHLDAAGNTLPITHAIFLTEDRIATLGSDGKMQLWLVKNDQAQIENTLSGDAVWTSIAATLDGKHLLAGARNGSLEWWDARQGARLSKWETNAGHTLAISAIALSADQSLAITGSQDNVAILWDVATGKMLKRLNGHTAGITSVGFSPDGKRAITASDDATAKLWDVANGVEILSFDQHQAEVTAAKFSPHGEKVLTASRDRTALLWPIRPIPPALGLREEQLAYRQPGVPQAIDSTPTFADADVKTFYGAELTVTLEGPLPTGLTDRLVMREGKRQRLELFCDEDKVLCRFADGDSATPVASLAYDAADGRLTVKFLATANHQVVEGILAQIAYEADWQELPLSSTRILRLHYRDADGAASAEMMKPIKYEAAAEEVISLPAAHP